MISPNKKLEEELINKKMYPRLGKIEFWTIWVYSPGAATCLLESYEIIVLHQELLVVHLYI